jgi:hypothetical protein
VTEAKLKVKKMFKLGWSQAELLLLALAHPDHECEKQDGDRLTLRLWAVKKGYAVRYGGDLDPEVARQIEAMAAAAREELPHRWESALATLKKCEGMKAAGVRRKLRLTPAGVELAERIVAAGIVRCVAARGITLSRNRKCTPRES